jgi:hypothetical protein
LASAKLPQFLLITYTSLPPEASAKATAVAEWETNQELLEYAANDRTLDVCPVEQKGLNLVPFQAGMDIANNAIHLSRRHTHLVITMVFCGQVMASVMQISGKPRYHEN